MPLENTGKHIGLATVGRSATQKVRKTCGFSMFSMISSILYPPWPAGPARPSQRLTMPAGWAGRTSWLAYARPAGRLASRPAGWQAGHGGRRRRWLRGLLIALRRLLRVGRLLRAVAVAVRRRHAVGVAAVHGYRRCVPVINRFARASRRCDVRCARGL